MRDISMELKLEIAKNTFSNANEYYNNFFKAYRERLEQYYQRTFDEHPDYFIFKQPVEVLLVLQNYNYYTFYLRSETGDQVRYITDFIESSKEYQEIKDLPKHIQEERILKLLNIETYLEKETSNYGPDFPKPEIPYWDAEMNGREKCDEHFQNYQFALAFKEASKPADNFPLFDMEPIYNKTNDEQFKYELSEAVKAYNSDLFLASTVTAAVSLETMLKNSIARILGPQYLPTEDRKKHTLNYAQILLQNQVIDERLNHRIRALNELRRSGAHSKSGNIKQWDAEQVISGIRIIVDSLYN